MSKLASESSTRTASTMETPVAPMAAPVSDAPVVWRRYALGLAALLLLLVVSTIDPYWTNILIVTYLFAGLAVAWNVIGGLGGQLSLGHGVYFAIGAYTVAIGYTKGVFAPWIGLLLAIPIGLAVAALTCWPVFRLRGPFFAMATLALNQVALVAAVYFVSVTGGPKGVSLPFRPALGNLMFARPWQYCLMMLVFLAVALAVALLVARGKLGYGLRAVREDQEAAAAAGVPVFRTKMAGMLVSAALTTVGGGLYVAYIGFVDPPTVLSLADVSVRIALLALVGGIGTTLGPVLGALVVIPLITVLQYELSDVRPGLNLVLVGALLVLIPLVFRRGLVGLGPVLRRRLVSAQGARR